jgi:hypothetical protein
MDFKWARKVHVMGQKHCILWASNGPETVNVTGFKWARNSACYGLQLGQKQIDYHGRPCPVLQGGNERFP